MKKKWTYLVAISVAVACLVIAVLAAVFEPPVEGYYSSATFSLMADDCRGFVEMRDGEFYVINIDKGYSDRELKGSYTPLAAGQARVVIDCGPRRSNIVTTVTTGWLGQQWENDFGPHSLTDCKRVLNPFRRRRLEKVR